MQAEDQYLHCVDALRRFVQDAGFSDAVVGLSGGMDSSLVAVMCVDALGADHVHGVLLPGPYSSDHSVADALELAGRLGIDAQTVSICEPYEAFERSLAESCGGALAGLAAQNTQARCRMVCLMALSNEHGWLLVNTGNKSEAMMGYSTLYGDMAGAFAPLGGLYKTDVYSLARWRNGQAAAGFCSKNADAMVSETTCPIPEHVFTKPPSAELAPGQMDEKSLGIDYPTLDAMLMAHVERGLNAEALIAEGFEAQTVERVLRTIRATAFKRAQEPPSPQVDFYA